MEDDWFHVPLQLTFGTSPFRELERMEHALDHMMDQSFPPARYLAYTGTQQQAIAREADRPRPKIQVAALNVRHYKPEEIMVKCEGGKVLVRGEHFSESNIGFEKGSFERKYDIPEGVDPKSITYQILSNGVLLIEAANPAIAEPQELQAVTPRGTFGGELVEDDKKFQVALNVAEYKPEEITVTVKGNELTIQGGHESEGEGHYRKSQFVRHFVLPPEVDMSTLRSSYSQGGLCIEAEKTPVAPKDEPRQLTIENKDD